jgi:hypothetical protein
MKTGQKKKCIRTSESLIFAHYESRNCLFVDLKMGSLYLNIKIFRSQFAEVMREIKLDRYHRRTGIALKSSPLENSEEWTTRGSQISSSQ